MLLKLKTPWVNFTNILSATFAGANPKSAKRHGWLDCLFALFGSSLVKGACKYVGEIYALLTITLYLQPCELHGNVYE